MVALLWFGASALATDPSPWSRSARDLAAGVSEDRRAASAERLSNAPMEALPDIAKQVLQTVAWHPDTTFPFRGTIPWFSALRLNETLSLIHI